MCDAISTFCVDGAEVSRRCTCECHGLCYYHKRMADGLLEPFTQNDTNGGGIVRVEHQGRALWKK
mgnify:CR=1 FL=1